MVDFGRTAADRTPALGSCRPDLRLVAWAGRVGDDGQAGPEAVGENASFRAGCAASTHVRRGAPAEAGAGVGRGCSLDLGAAGAGPGSGAIGWPAPSSNRSATERRRRGTVSSSVPNRLIGPKATPGLSGPKARRAPEISAGPSWPRPARSNTTSPPSPLSRSSTGGDGRGGEVGGAGGALGVRAAALAEVDIDGDEGPGRLDRDHAAAGQPGRRRSSSARGLGAVGRRPGDAARDDLRRARRRRQVRPRRVGAGVTQPRWPLAFAGQRSDAPLPAPASLRISTRTGLALDQPVHVQA